MLKQLVRLPLLLLLLCSNVIHAQNNAIAISSFTVKHDLPPNIDEWRSIPAAASMVVENKTWGDRPLRLVIMLKQGDKNICGSDGIDLDYFKTRSFQTNDLLQGLKNCESLKTGDYTLCARFMGMGDNRQWVDVSPEVCKPFSVGGAGNQKYSGTTLISPANNKVFTEKEASAPITFRCTPIVPKPQEPVIYHFRIWQVAAGQTASQAMTTNPPIITKDVENITQTTITSGLWPCRPNCQFVWKVKVTNREGKPYGENGGESEVSLFSVSQYIIQIDSLKVTCSQKAGTYDFKFYVTNPNATTAYLSSLVITSSTLSGASLGTYTPVTGTSTTISPSAQLVITGTINASSLTNICIGAQITDANNAFWQASKDECIDVAPCICDFCENGGINITQGNGSSNYAAPNMAHILQDFTVSPNNIIKMTAEIVYVKDSVTSEDCRVCNDNENDVFQFISGNTITGFGSVTNPVYGSSSPTPPSKILTWTSSSAAGENINPAHFDLNIGLPATSTLDCCNQYDKICIRYTFWDINCKACSIMVCYELYKTNQVN